MALLCSSYYTQMSLYTCAYIILYHILTIDDTVIVHHGETCSVRLFVLFRETVFSPLLSPTPATIIKAASIMVSIARGPRGKKRNNKL